MTASISRAKQMNDHDVLMHEQRFVWRNSDLNDMTNEQRFAYDYYSRLFKEYCLVDLSRYKTGGIALRWRVQAEVFEGKGQYVCGELRCDRRRSLSSWEVPFSYPEHGEVRSTLVKVRLCPRCARRLNCCREGGKPRFVKEGACMKLGNEDCYSGGKAARKKPTGGCKERKGSRRDPTY